MKNSLEIVMEQVHLLGAALKVEAESEWWSA